MLEGANETKRVAEPHAKNEGRGEKTERMLRAAKRRVDF